MKLRQRFNEDNSAVSPVIGVILMVAITVILAAVIASFVLGLGPDTATTPTATFDSEYADSPGTDGTVTITMESGTTLDVDDLEIAGDYDDSGADSENDVTNEGEISLDSGSEITAGTSFDVKLDTDSGDDYEIRLIYVEGDTTSTIQTFEGSV